MSNKNDCTHSDQELAELIKQNDTEAFRELYYKYYRNLIHYGWHWTRSMDSSRDLVQETFTRVWINRNRLNPEKSIKAYLYKTIHNLIINQNKLHSSKNVSLDDDNESRSQSPNDDRELTIDVQTAVNNLPEKLRTVFLLSRIEGFSYSEIAVICSISQKAVEKRMSRAFDTLRKLFSEKYFG